MYLTICHDQVHACHVMITQMFKKIWSHKHVFHNQTSVNDTWSNIVHGHTNVNTWSNVRFHDQHVNWLMTKCCAFQFLWHYRWKTATNDQTCISWSHKCQHTNTMMWLIKCLDYQQTHKKCASHDHLSQVAFHMITQISLVHKCWFMTSYYFQQTSHGQPHKFWHTFSIKIVTEADVTSGCY